ncbi:DUF882 domain-containing protein [Microvirga sp. 2YAF29]|uniref:DUF882 domain-containing protein n=1 Tax=Microvirga sp. 2YAF29 TaxID=3233031 RepID=UPI003F9BD377
MLAGSFWAGAHAEGETRSLSFFHTHSQETATVTFRRDGRFDEQALTQLNWFLRDWRNDKPTKMDPRLFDILWEVYRESGSRQPIHIISSYRSPETNSALRRRSSGVAENSQHMLGKAMDIRLPDVTTERLREIAMKMQYGGVGYYASSGFVHVDTGNVRAWPRMSQQQLARLFPDGNTAHLPSSGKPLPGYEQARVQIAARNETLATQASAGGGSIGSLFANIFGRKTPASAPVPAGETVVASVEPEKAAAIEPTVVPLPPQRPRLEATQVAVAEPNALIVSEADEQKTSTRRIGLVQPILGFNEKAAIRSLFEPRIALADNGFAPKLADDLSTTRFTGPAVRAPDGVPDMPATQWAGAEPRTN